MVPLLRLPTRCSRGVLFQTFPIPFPSESSCRRHVASSATHGTSDPRLNNLGPVLEDEFSILRESYRAPTHPIILAHGLFGFDELHVAGPNLPGIQYWRGIKEALAARGVEVVTVDVPASSSVENRAAKLVETIERWMERQSLGKGQKVNVIGGLDSRYMISNLRPTSFEVVSLTTIASPHRGSAYADFVLNQFRPWQLKKIYKAAQSVGMNTGAFDQLTRSYMENTFNPANPDSSSVKYYSYGATFDPSFWSVFRQSFKVIDEAEGPNDGLVSVASSKWGDYKGTLTGVSHLDLINWTNRLRWYAWELAGNKRNFNAIAFYLDIAEMLAKQGM